MRIAILGAGRMGSWLAVALKGKHEILVRDPEGTSERALGNLGVELAGSDAEIGGFKPEMLLNCVPLGHTVAAFSSVARFLPPACMLSDIASVKTGLSEYYASEGRPFVSTHPMFGPTFADVSLLEGQSAVIISESCDAGKELFTDFYEDLGIRIFMEDFDGHDRTVAYSLATPFASTMVFAACMKHVDAPGTNFRKHLDIARGLLSEDDRLLAEIMFNPHTARRLELIGSQISYLTHIIKDRDHDEMGKFLQRLRGNIGLEAGPGTGQDAGMDARA